MVRAVSDDVAVLCLGRVCERGPTQDLSAAAAHPYTAALFAAVPSPDGRSATGPSPDGTAPTTPPGTRIDPPCSEPFATTTAPPSATSTTTGPWSPTRTHDSRSTSGSPTCWAG
ncbi:hypothetical protein ACFRCG_37880 [Embleya sp. NPDC056575]|uniref:ABC transporter ATP-binding protein n=1 Tax=unclassified Embleya TaxID=2699296 RepID=UPI0036A82877